MQRLTNIPVLAALALTLVLVMVGYGAHTTGAQQATSTPSFGPITGPDYAPGTPAAEATPLPAPAELDPLPCHVNVVAAQVPIYSEPNALAQQTGTAAQDDRLRVSDLQRDASGQAWVATSGGWLPLMLNGARQAELETVRTCGLLQEGRPVKSTAFGLHLITANEGDQVIQLVQQLQANGITLGTIKGLNHTEQLLNDVKRMSPETIVVYRSLLTTTNGLTDCPNWDSTSDFARLARDWINSLTPYWDAVNADYYEIMNECGASWEAQTQFSIEAMKVANEQGRCLLIYSFTAGQPEIEAAEALLPAFEYAANNPCQPGRYHGIAMHASAFDKGLALAEGSEWMTLRHRKLRERIIGRVPKAANLPFFLTEASVGGGGGKMSTPSCDMIVPDAVQYSYLLEQDPYVWGFHEWSFGSGTGWWDLSPCLDGIAQVLIDYYQSAP